MAWAEGSSPAASSSSYQLCEHVWEMDDSGSLSVDVCVVCGMCRDHAVFEADEGLSQEHPLGITGSSFVGADGALSGRGNSHLPVAPEKRRELRFIRIIKEVAGGVRLSKPSLNTCITEGKDLLRTGENIGQGMKKFAAGLVFLELKKSSPNITFKGTADQLGVKRKALGAVVKKLTARARKLERETVPSVVPFETRLDGIFDKLNLSMLPEERQNVKKMAQDVRDICADVPSKNNFLLLDTESLDYAYFALALQAVDCSRDEKAVVDMVSEKSGLHCPSLKYKVYQIRCRLITVAKEIASLEHIKDLNSRTILRYLPTIIQNKAFLIKGEDRFNYSQ